MSIARRRVRQNEADKNWLNSEFSRIEKSLLMISGILKESQRQDCLRVEKVALSELLQDAIGLFGAKAANLGIEIQFNPLINEPKMLVNSIRLQQVFLNLLENAVDAAANSANKIVQIYCESTAQNILIHVKDWGPGISDDIKERIFLPLVTTKNTGAGLGLSISRQIIRDHGGDIQLLHSNHPTHFCIDLPILVAHQDDKKDLNSGELPTI